MNPEDAKTNSRLNLDYVSDKLSKAQIHFFFHSEAFKEQDATCMARNLVGSFVGIWILSE